MKAKLSLILFAAAFLTPHLLAYEWAEWNFDSDFDGSGVLVADDASDAGSSLAINNAAYSVAGGKLVCAGSSDTADFLQLNIADMLANGGGSYVNEYTIIWDIKTDSSPDWIGLFNTNPGNSNAAELWLSGSGSVGKGGSYSADGVVPQETLTRLVAVYKVVDGSIIQNIYADGVNVLADVNVSGVDGGLSLYTAEQQAAWQVALFGGNDGGMYLDACELENFGFTTEPLTDAQVADLGGVSSNVFSSVKAKNPQPTNGETLVDPTDLVTWEAPEDYVPSKYDVYFGTDPNVGQNPKVIDGQNVTSYDPTLTFGEVYYWRVDAYDGTTVYPGSVWSFETMPAIPVITKQPTPVTVAVGEVAEFTVEATNAATYEWYREIGGGVLGTDATLAVTVTDDSFEDKYYCIVKNTAGQGTPTDHVRLLTERLIASWDFEGDLLDVVAGKVGTYTDPNENNDPPTPVFVGDGVSGSQALSFDENNFFVEVEDAEYFNFTSQGFTVAAWVKTDAVGTYYTWLSKGGTFWFDMTGEGKLVGGIFGSITSDVAVTDGGWHYFAMTFDSETKVATCYADGVAYGTIDNAENASDAAILFGAADTTGRNGFQGQIDDASIWSYPLDPYAVADLYTTASGTSVCVNKEGLQYDFNDDCRIDLGDFVMFAEEWLNCNSVPDCIQ